MLETLVGSVFFDALVLSGLLYLIARHEADIDFQKLAMVVAGTALGNVGLRVAVNQAVPPGIQIWLQPLLEVALAAFMIMTFCWISFWKSLMVVTLFASLHISFGLAMKAVARKVLGDEKAAPSITEQHEADIQDTKAEMERMWKLQAGAESAPTDVPAAEPPSATPPAAAETAVPTAEVAESALFAVEPVAGAGAASPPKPKPPASPAEAWAEARKGLRINGISKQGRVFTALVNQRPVRSGDVVAATYAGKTYRWTIQEIAFGEVRLKPLEVTEPSASVGR